MSVLEHIAVVQTENRRATRRDIVSGLNQIGDGQIARPQSFCELAHRLVFYPVTFSFHGEYDLVLTVFGGDDKHAISVAHYGEQNGDLMRDPEMCFELSQPIGGKLKLDPWYWRNDYLGVEQWSRTIVRGHYVHLMSLHEQHEKFAQTWDVTLRLQGFAEAFTDKSIRG